MISYHFYNLFFLVLSREAIFIWQLLDSSIICHFFYRLLTFQILLNYHRVLQYRNRIFQWTITFEPLNTLFSWAVFINLQTKMLQKYILVWNIPLQYLDLQILCFKEGNRVLSAVHFMIVILAQKTAGCYGRKQMVTKDVFEKIRQEDVLGCCYSCSSKILKFHRVTNFW